MRRKTFGHLQTNRPGRARKLLDEYRRGLLPADSGQTGPDDAAFLQDAVEGIDAFGDRRKLDDYVYQLNTQLAQRTGNKQRPHRRTAKNILNLPLIILLLLLLLLLAYWVVSELLKA